MTTRDIVLIALFAAITATLALFPPLTVPVIGVPVTAQSMGPMLAGSILGARRGGLALALFTVLVLAGLPLLAGGRGGLVILAGPTGGFFVAWPFVAMLIGALHERAWRRGGVWASVLFNIAGGLGLQYLIGVPWLAAATGMPLLRAAAAVAIFVPGDLLKAVLTAFVAEAVRRSYPVMAPAA